MHRGESRTDLGTIKIHDNVIASIASVAACEIEGVKGISKNFRSGIMDLISKDISGAIKVEKDKNGEITLIVPLIIKYGFNIPEIANKVQESVRSALEKMTNVSVRDIDIVIQGVEKEVIK